MTPTKVVTVAPRGIQCPLAPIVWSSEYKEPGLSGFLWLESRPLWDPRAPQVVLQVLLELRGTEAKTT